MDVLYTCRSGENEELRYSIRSIVANYDFDRLVIVGDKPEWCAPDIFIPVEKVGSKWDTTRNNYQVAFNTGFLADTVAIFNDDFFVMRRPRKQENYRMDKMLSRYRVSNDVEPSRYHDNLRKFNEYLPSFNNNFELHMPMIVPTKETAYILRNAPNYEFVNGSIRSYIGNSLNLKAKVVCDNKEEGRSFANPKATYYSTNDNTFKGKAGDFIRAAFPNKSKYER